MESIVKIVVGILLIIMGYLIGIRKEINLVHSYHHKRVKEEDKKSFCKGVGFGNAICGVGLTLFPIINMGFSCTIAICVMGTLVAIGFIIAIVTIIRFNKGLF